MRTPATKPELLTGLSPEVSRRQAKAEGQRSCDSKHTSQTDLSDPGPLLHCATTGYAGAVHPLSLNFRDRDLPALSARARDAHGQGANSYGIGEASSGLPLWGARRAQAPRLGLPGQRCAV